MAFKISRHLPAIAAWLVLLGITSAFYYLVIPGFVAVFKYVGIIFAILEMLLFISVVSNFLAATFMDPGVMPKASETEEQQHNKARAALYQMTEIQGISVRMKWCVTCHFYRPPRCSHCSVCDHCIDSFDHHCPWLNNCIGHRNYRHFFTFLLTLTLHILCVFFYCFVYTFWTKDDLLTPENIGSMIIMALSGMNFMPVIGLTSFHLFLVATGRTTNEQVTGKYRSGYNPFNKGFCRNVAAVCFGSQFPRFADYIGHQELPVVDRLVSLNHDPTTSGVATGSRYPARPVPVTQTPTELHQVQIYTSADLHGSSGLKKHGHDAVVEYKPLKKQQADLLKVAMPLDVEDRGSNLGDVSRDSSMITIRRFPKQDNGLGDDGSVSDQGSKCNLLESSADSPLIGRFTTT